MDIPVGSVQGAGAGSRRAVWLTPRHEKSHPKVAFLSTNPEDQGFLAAEAASAAALAASAEAPVAPEASIAGAAAGAEASIAGAGAGAGAGAAAGAGAGAGISSFLPHAAKAAAAITAASTSDLFIVSYLMSWKGYCEIDGASTCTAKEEKSKASLPSATLYKKSKLGTGIP